MENGFIYLIKASGLIGLFYFAYFLLLRKETFFSANRWFLLLGLITSSVLPLFFITKIIWVEPTTDSFDWSTIPVTTSVTAPEPEINWYLVLACVYFTGIVILFLKLVFDFNSLIQLLKGKIIQQKGAFKLIDIAENIAPFSYFNYIVYNSTLYTAIELENILEHEKVHSQQKHSIDVLISRLFCVVFWFNPLIWLYKKAIAQNLEFIADSEAAKKISDKKAYQFTLLKITTQENCVALTNHFYQSLIKKRIIMLNQNQSEKWNSWKYFTVFPALVAFVFLFQIEVVAQEKIIPQEEKGIKKDSVDLKSFKIKKDLPNLTKEKEVIIDGKQSTKEDLDKLNPNDIEKIDVATISGKKTILVTKKTKKDNKDISPKPYDVVYIDGEKISQSELENNFVFRNVKDVKIVEGKTNKTYYITTNTTTQKTDNYKFEFIITKNTTDEEIKEKCRQIKETYNIDLAIHNIKRNSKGEITHIECKDEGFLDGKINIFSQTRNPIEPFKFYHNNKITEGRQSKARFATLSNMISRIIDNKSVDYKKAIILIDGEQSNYKALEKVNPKEIKQVITSDIKSNAEENQKYVELYGEKALYGILIQLKTNEYYNKNK